MKNTKIAYFKWSGLDQDGKQTGGWYRKAYDDERPAVEAVKREIETRYSYTVENIEDMFGEKK